MLTGGNRKSDRIYEHNGMAECYKLNTKTCRLSKIASLPVVKLAHQVIFIPHERGYQMVPSTKQTKKLLSSFKADVKGKFSYAKRSEIKDNKLGMIYCFGGKKSFDTYS